jgi:hypothetical protein
MRFTSFDPSVPAPRPPIGWYDLDAAIYPPESLPPQANRVILTAEQWDSRLTKPYAIDANGKLIEHVFPPTVEQALTLLNRQRASREAAGVWFQPTGAAVPILFASDASAQARLGNAETLAAKGRWPDGTPFQVRDGSYTPMAAADIEALAEKVGAYVVACLNRAAQLDALVRENPATDITTDWPDNH